MSELPKGWAAATLNDLLGAGGLFSDGDWVESKDQDPDGQNRLLQLADIGDGFFVDKSSRFVNDEKFSSLNCTEVKEGDVLIARMPDPLGRACLMPAIPQRCLTVVDVAIFRVGETGVSNKWLMHFLNSSPVRLEIEQNSSGTTRKRISRGKLGEILLPVPPLAEQTRIAAKLDELLAQVEPLKDRIDCIPALLKRFRQSVLAAAISGRLTEEWRATLQSAECWKTVPVGALCSSAFDGPFGSKLKSDDYTAEGVRVVRLENIGHLSFIGEKKTFISVAKHAELSKNTLRTGDILFSSFVDEEIRVCRLPKSEEVFINKADCFCLRIDDTTANPSFVMYALAAKHTYQRIRESVHGATRPRINLGFLKSFEIELPPQAEQTEIVRCIEQLFAFADQLEAKVASAKSRIDHLTQSILAKAFRGELVPQNPSDEPASLLLEGIKAQRAAAPKAKRGRKVSV